MSKRFSEHERSTTGLRCLADVAYRHPRGAPVAVMNGVEVVLGGRTVQAAGQGTVLTLALDGDAPLRTALMALETAAEPSPTILAQAASALRRAGVPLRVAGRLLSCSVMDTSCWARLASNPELLAAVSAGHVSFGHARYLLSAPASRRLTLLGSCVAGHWTVKRLRQVLAAGVTASLPAGTAADLTDYRQQLEASLGAEVAVDWRPNQRSVRIAWHDVPTLQGLLERIGSGRPNRGPSATSRQRWLVIPVVDADELDELFGHLVDNGEG